MDDHIRCTYLSANMILCMLSCQYTPYVLSCASPDTPVADGAPAISVMLSAFPEFEVVVDESRLSSCFSSSRNGSQVRVL